MQTEVAGFSETVLIVYHTSPCHLRTLILMISHAPIYTVQLPLSILSILFASNSDISQSFSALRNALHNTINRRQALSLCRISFPFLLQFLDFILEIHDRIVQRLIERLVNPQKQTNKQTNRISLIHFWIRFRFSEMWRCVFCLVGPDVSERLIVLALRGRRHCAYLSVCDSMILKWILKK